MSRSKRNAAAAAYFERAPNYSAEANEDLLEFARVAMANGAQGTAAIVVELSRALLSGHKFALPRGGRTFENELSATMLEEFRLPYNISVFEFEAAEPHPSCPQTRGGITFQPVPRRIALCIDWDSWSTPFPTRYRSGQTSGCVVWPIGYRQVGSRWMWCADGHGASVGYCNVLTVGAGPDVLGSLGIVQEDGRPYQRAGFTFPIGFPCLGELGRDSFAHLTEDQKYAAATLDTRDELAAVIQACAALSCTNVTTEVIRPNNEARAARPGSTLFDYHVLVLDPSKVREPGEPLGGTHASPRAHLRRGHIRNHPTAGRIWVNSCVVNPTAIGTVNKDYAIRKGGRS